MDTCFRNKSDKILGFGWNGCIDNGVKGASICLKWIGYNDYWAKGASIYLPFRLWNPRINWYINIYYKNYYWYLTIKFELIKLYLNLKNGLSKNWRGTSKIIIKKEVREWSKIKRNLKNISLKQWI